MIHERRDRINKTIVVVPPPSVVGVLPRRSAIAEGLLPSSPGQPGEQTSRPSLRISLPNPCLGFHLPVGLRRCFLHPRMNPMPHL